MTVYVHRGMRIPTHLEALQQERERVAAEALVYEELLRQQQRLADLRQRVHQRLGPPPAAETVRQAAIIRNGDSTDTCAARLKEAEADAAQWVDPRSRKEAS